MSSAIKSAILNPQSCSSNVRTALFHSTPILERKRRSFWESRHNNFNKRYSRLRGKQQLLRNVSAFTDYLFQNWQDEFNNDDPSSSKSNSWFKKQYSKGHGRDRTGNREPRGSGRRRFEFCEDDDELEIEYILRSGFGGNRFSFWTFINDDEPRWRSSSSYSNHHRRSWNWRYRVEDDYDSSTESESLGSDMASDRLALGLSPSGPLKLEDVKSAYRECALKWHPDRHQGSSKAVAEEKFKLCSAAYQSLCDRLPVT